MKRKADLPILARISIYLFHKTFYAVFAESKGRKLEKIEDVINKGDRYLTYIEKAIIKDIKYPLPGNNVEIELQKSS